MALSSAVDHFSIIQVLLKGEKPSWPQLPHSLCAWVSEREREREREGAHLVHCGISCGERVCVCQRERERERNTGRQICRCGLAVGEGNQFNMQTGGMVVRGPLWQLWAVPPGPPQKFRNLFFKSGEFLSLAFFFVRQWKKYRYTNKKITNAVRNISILNSESWRQVAWFTSVKNNYSNLRIQNRNEKRISASLLLLCSEFESFEFCVTCLRKKSN